MENDTNKKISLIERFKSFKIETWVIIALELLMAILLIYFDIGFWVDMAKGISFLGEANKAYEYTICVLLLLLSLAMLVIIVYDLFFRDYLKEEKNVTKKIIKNGKVIALESEAEKEKSAQDKKDK